MDKHNKEKMMSLYETDKYEVVLAGPLSGIPVLGEDGKYGDNDGYAVVNKETNVVEHTSTMLPGAIYQCMHFNDTLTAQLTPKTIAARGEDIVGELLEDMSIVDVVGN